MKLNLCIIVGTTRPKRQSIHAARLIEEVGSSYEELDITFVDPSDYDLSLDGNDDENKIAEYSQIVEDADIFFIVTPEYNHSFPGSLKSLIDKELGKYNHKAVAFAGVSSGMIGGARAIQALNGVVRELGLVSVSADVHFPRVQEMFDDDGKLINQDQIERIKTVYDELIWMGKALKRAREE
ncbi:MAG: NADPH-dependent FMN reductase [Candidatus Saccharimonadales bacterium]